MSRRDDLALLWAAVSTITQPVRHGMHQRPNKAALIKPSWSVPPQMTASDKEWRIGTAFALMSAAAAWACYSLYALAHTYLVRANTDEDLEGTLLYGDEDEEEELPDDMPIQYRDPISLGIIRDPVVLCATGHVYDYKTIKDWFSRGNRLCPKSNVEVLDTQICRLPWLKREIQAWMHKHDLTPPDDSEDLSCLRALDPKLPEMLAHIRARSGTERVQALIAVFELLKEEEEPEGASPEHADLLKRLREEVIDDMVWIIRYADQYEQGIAASVLAYCDASEECGWLAACATAPAVSICMSPDRYTSQAGTRLLYNIACAGATARACVCHFGGVPALVHIISTPRDEYGYSRDRAAATLAILVQEPKVSAYLLQHAVGHLLDMLRQDEERWEKRDAAALLLKLNVPQDQLEGFTLKQLVELWWCSKAWLQGKVQHPTEGYGEDEAQCAAVVSRLDAREHDLPTLIAENKVGELALEEPPDTHQEQ